MVVAGILTPPQIGHIKILQSYLAIAVIFSSMGINLSVLKLCSEKTILEQKKKHFSSAIVFVIISSIVTFIIFYIISKSIDFTNNYTVNHYFAFFLLALFPFTLNQVHFSYVQALKKIKLLSKIQFFTKSIALVLTIILTYYYQVFGFLISIIFGYSLTSAVLFFYNRKDVLTNIKSFRSEFFKHWVVARFSFLANLVSAISKYLDILLLSYFILDSYEVGYYSFAVNFILFLQIITDTIIKLTMPYFSEKSNHFSSWINTYQKYSRLFILSVTVILICANIFVEPVINMIFSYKYSQSIFFIRILTLKWFFYSLIQYKSSALFGLGKINYNFYGSVIFLGINIITQFLSLKLFGIEGLVFGVLIAVIFYYGIYLLLFKHAIRKF